MLKRFLLALIPVFIVCISLDYSLSLSADLDKVHAITTLDKILEKDPSLKKRIEKEKDIDENLIIEDLDRSFLKDKIENRNKVSFMQDRLTYWVFMAVIMVVSICLAIYMNRRLQRNEPNVKSYIWGYYIGWNGVILGFILALLLIASNTPNKGFLIFIFFLIYSHIYILLRRKWAWILGTILTLNLIIWLINFKYVMNRWNEFKGQPLRDNLKSLKLLFKYNVAKEVFGQSNDRVICPNCGHSNSPYRITCKGCKTSFRELNRELNKEKSEIKAIKIKSSSNKINGDTKIHFFETLKNYIREGAKMRKASFVLNVILLIMVIEDLIEDGFPRSFKAQLIYIILLVTPIFSMITLWHLNSNPNSENWLSLFLERKKLEEKAKLEKLKSNAK